MRYFALYASCLLSGMALLTAACNTRSQPAEAPVKNWMAEPFAASPQVLLTNAALFRDGQRLDGASAFLVQAGAHTYVVSAKHLIGEDGGIEPAKLPSQLNAELVSWKLFARAQAADTLQAGPLRNVADTDSSDALVFDLKRTSPHYQALVPRYDLPAPGEEVYLIGCSYAEPDCRQNRYPVRLIEASATEYLLTRPEGVETKGFSGCPVVDKQGRVIGLLSGRVEYQDGTQYTRITPITAAQPYLQP